MDWQTPLTPAVDFEDVAQRAIEALPEPFRIWLEPVVLAIGDFADARTLARMEIDSRWDLLGLYEGHPIGARSVELSGTLPDRISLYRQPILAYARQHDAPLEDVIVHVLIHEIGHHFGLSDEDMERIEAEASPNP